jgi:murein DD-endopeptidase MepM/ murein hydrolase activator NlpD
MGHPPEPEVTGLAISGKSGERGVSTPSVLRTARSPLSRRARTRLALLTCVALLSGLLPAAASAEPPPAEEAQEPQEPEEPEETGPSPEEIAAETQRLRERWDEALETWRANKRRAAEARTALLPVARQAQDATADLTGIRSTRSELAADLDAKRAEVEHARQIEAELRGVAEAARVELDEQQDRMGSHAAAIYRSGPSPLGAIESVLRSGSPTDYHTHMKMRGSVLEFDYVVFRGVADRWEEADGAWQHAAEVLEGHEEDLAELDATHEAIEELSERQSGVAGSAASNRARQLGTVQRHESSAAAARTRIGDAELQLREVNPDALSGWVERRRSVEAATESKLNADFPARSRALSWSRPHAFPTIVGYACPVPGGTFINDWAFPRSGGRTHEGTDIFADRHAPIHAVADGTVLRVDHSPTGSLGGRTVTIENGEGERWYYAHFEEIADDIEPELDVEAGRLLGTVGDSGNARGTPPHLHIGRYIHDVAANPFPAMFVACHGDDADEREDPGPQEDDRPRRTGQQDRTAVRDEDGTHLTGLSRFFR